MKKLILTLIVMSFVYLSSAQITKTIDISAITGADTSFYFEKSETAYSYSLGEVAHFYNIAGTGGIFYFLNSPADSLIIKAVSTAYPVDKDTTHAIRGVNMPFEYNGFKLIKGSLTGGYVTFYLSRKTRK